MSAVIMVFLHDSTVPTVEAWNAAIKAEGFHVVIDPFDLRKDTGYRPAFLGSQGSGFEWYLSKLDTAKEDPAYPFRQLVVNCNLQATLSYSTMADEGLTATIAAAVLAKITGGYFFDNENGDAPLLKGDEAVAFARKAVEQWRKKPDAKYLRAAASSILAPIMKSAGFIRVSHFKFARQCDGIIQEFGITKGEGDFRVWWGGQALYPVREFLAGTDPVCIKDWHSTETQAETDAGMKKAANDFLEFILPWFEETKTTGGMLDYLTEFLSPDAHRLFDIACLLVKLGREREAVGSIKRAITQYEDQAGCDWTEGYIKLCNEMLAAIENGTSFALLEKWRVQSLHHLGLKKLLEQEQCQPLPTPSAPPVIPNFMTAAVFSRDIARPAIAATIQRTLPGFYLVRPGTLIRTRKDGIYDFILFRTMWSGFVSMTLGSNYDANWQGNIHTLLGASVAMEKIRREMLGDTSGVDYRYNRSELELQKQLALISQHLAQSAEAVFVACGRIMQEKPIIRFGLKQVAGRPLNEEEKTALKRELHRAMVTSNKTITNSRFLELREKLKRFAEQHCSSLADVREGSLAEELLLADLHPGLGRIL